MSKISLNLIAAAAQDLGIGINGKLPWRLKKEMEYFTTMTSKVENTNKQNAVVMGRVTWDCIPEKYRPLSGRLNIVLTRNVENVSKNVPEGVIVVQSLDDAIKTIEARDDIESTWVIGGSAVYKAAMEHPNCGRIFLTHIEKSFECDTFFPKIEESKFTADEVPGVPSEPQVENNLTYYFRVYKKL